MQAVYNLAEYPCNFNFVEFLVASITEGVENVVFDDSKGYKPKYSKPETLKRVESILLPACDLAGVTYEFGAGKGIDPGYHISAVIKAFRKNGRIKKLKSVLPHGKKRFTVTIRNSKRYPERNSSDAWRKFADEIGAYVIEEYDDKPIDLRERMALYCGAEMNYMVATGPGILCLCSDAPITLFMKAVSKQYHAEQGFPVGSSLPWLSANQRIVWSGDSYEELKKWA